MQRQLIGQAALLARQRRALHRARLSRVLQAIEMFVCKDTLTGGNNVIAKECCNELCQGLQAKTNRRAVTRW